jgi:hypothetical protein
MIVVARVALARHPAAIRGAATCRTGRSTNGTLVRERGRARADAVRGYRDADLASGGWPRSGNLDQRGSDRDAEHKPERQEGELAGGHVPVASSVA